MRDDHPHRGGYAGPIAALLGFLVFFPVLYILSCGPAVALMTRGYLSRQVFDIAYFPLLVAAEAAPWIGRALESYAQLWAA